MRIGILANTNRASGGVYQYSQSMLRALHEWKEAGCEDEFVVFTSSLHPPVHSSNGSRWEVRSLKIQEPESSSRQTLNTLRGLVGEGPHRELWRWLRKAARPANTYSPKSRPDITKQLNDAGVELMLYPEPDSIPFEAGVPYVMAIHDLQHRLHPEFPEVSADGEWDWREYVFRNGAQSATLLLADSEVGKEDILNLYGPYGVVADSVKVLPFIPASYLVPDVPETERQRVRKLYRLPDKYLFYPAQFWPHKNHKRLVQALGLLKQERGLEISIAFCGSYTGEVRANIFEEVNSIAVRMGIDRQLRYLGYVPDEDMSGIYAGAVALTMPTFFGPTNIPVVEAWAFGCPVLTSDIRGIREQAQHAAVLVDPTSVESIADGIHRLWTDGGLSQILVAGGRKRLAAYTPADFRRKLIEIIEEAKGRVEHGQRTRSR
jgi:glycosyltransferase involved in cell wall biosynthesis